MQKSHITYLDNSGFALETGERFFVFDYYNNHPAGGRLGLAGGVIDPAEIAGKNVFVFVSHAHYDHYNKVIFQWERQIKNIHYILSDDIPPRHGALIATPGQSYELDGMRIDVLRSTDEGAAFLIDAGGQVIYHAGDLNWWHWEGEDPRWNADMAAAYQKEIHRLKDVAIDIAFVPVDPRLGDNLLLGVDHLMRTADVRLAVPMHYSANQKAVANAIATAPQTGPYRSRIVPPLRRGQSITV